MWGKQSTGTSEHLPSVTIPNVPSPINSLVKSNPVADLRDLRLVLMISPEGRTTVYEVMGRACVSGTGTRGSLVVSTDRIQEPFAFRCSISNGVGYAIEVECQGGDRKKIKYELVRENVYLSCVIYH